METNDRSRQQLSLFPNSFTELCFDRSEFSRPDFNVDNFLAKARRRGASLEQIRDDARVYLKIIQNSMIELINQDYADFVHLSSNLAGLRGAVEKLGVEVEELTSEFESTATKIEAAVVDLTKEYEEKQKLSKEQQYLETSLEALSRLENLKKLLSSVDYVTSTNDDDQFRNVCQIICRASYFIDELHCIKASSKNHLHCTFEHSLNIVVDYFQKWLESKLIYGVQCAHSLLVIHVLRGFTACDRLDSARASFLAHFVEPELRTCFSMPKKQKIGKLEQLKLLLEKILILQKQFRPIFCSDSFKRDRLSTDTTAGIEESLLDTASSFLDDCLLMSLLNCLQDRFSSIIIPTDAHIFRSAYRSLISFSETWIASNGGNKILKMIFDKFSLLVYYQLYFQDTTAAIDSNLSSVDEILRQNDAVFSLKSTSFIFTKLLQVWALDNEDDGLFLPPLSAKCWELTCMIINRYGRHILDAVDKSKRETENVEARLLTNGEASTISKRASTPTFTSSSQRSQGSEMSTLLIRYSGDLKNLQRRVFDDLLHKILNQCQLDDLSGNNLSQCLIETFSNLQRNVDESIAEVLVPWLSTQISNQLGSVIEVPRQYRWTRKEAPTQPSPYLLTALDPVSRLLLVSSEKLSDDSGLINGILERVLANVVGSYTENLKSVLESVEKISSSLSRLKTKGGKLSNAAENVGAVSDEQKIRLQLRLDVEEFERLIKNLSSAVICDLSEMKSLIAFNSVVNEA